MKLTSLICLVWVLAVGCAVGPDYKPPNVSMPDSWAGATEKGQPSSVTDKTLDLSRWWRQFEDPILTALIEEALKANLSLAIAEARLRQARAVRGIAVAGFMPSATASAFYKRQTGYLYTDGDPRSLYQAGLDAAWELDIFGGIRRNVESANANVQAAIESIRDVEVSLVAEVALNYMQLRGYQQQIVIANNNLKIQRHTADITRKRYDVGFASGLDVANAQSVVATTESQIPVFETGERQSIYALSVLLARHPGDLVERLSPTENIPAIPDEIPAGLPSDLLRRRPDIRQAEAQLHSATAQIGVAVAKLFPQFSLTGGANWQSTLASTWWQGSNRSLLAGSAAAWPIFQGGALISNVRAQEALRDQALLAYQKTILTALEDVEKALVAFIKEQRHYKLLGDAVAADRKAVQLSLQLYREGQVEFLNVLVAQRSLYTDENALVQSRRSIATNLIALYKALGGGWETVTPP